jgi:transcriptional regulator with XRE-family HTH domain
MPPTTQINPDALTAIRERSGLNITQLAALVREHGVQVERSHLSNVEAGRRPASVSLQQALAKALKVPLPAIVTASPQASRDSAA